MHHLNAFMFSQYLVKYYFSHDAYVFYWVYLFITKLGKSPSSYKSIHTKQCVTWTVSFYRQSAISSTHFMCNKVFYLCRSPCHWDGTHSRASTWVPRQISQSLSPIVSPLKWNSDTLAWSMDSFCSERLNICVKFLPCKLMIGKSITKRREKHKILCSLLSTGRQNSLQFSYNNFPPSNTSHLWSEKFK